MNAKDVLNKTLTHGGEELNNDTYTQVVSAIKAYAEAEREKAFNQARQLKPDYPKIDNVVLYNSYEEYKTNNPLI